MIELEKDCYLIDFDKKDKYSIGSIFMGKVIISMELYYYLDEHAGDLDKYIRIRTMPINFNI